MKVNNKMQKIYNSSILTSMLTASFMYFIFKKILNKLTWYIFLILQTGKIHSSCLHAL